MQDDSLNRFSLRQYYGKRNLPRFIHKIEVVLWVLLILYTPLPFGSVENHSILIIELIALTCFLLWMIQLIFGGNSQELLRFRTLYGEARRTIKASPFFRRHYWLTLFAHMLTFRVWPKKNIAPDLVEEESDTFKPGLNFHSVFGYPVNNTGIEGIAIFILLLLLFQLIPLPNKVIDILSPSTAQLYQEAAKVTATELNYYPVSLSPFLTSSKILEYLAYFSLYLVLVNNPYPRSIFRSILIAFVISSGFQAGYGLFEFLSGHQHIFTFQKKFNRDCATGTFINRNHYAVYLEMALPILLSFVAGQFDRFREMGGKLHTKVSHLMEIDGGRTLLYSFLIVLVSLALLFSLSRSGIAFGLIACSIFFLLFQKADLKIIHRKTYWIIVLFGAIALAAFIGLNPLLERFQQITDEFSAEGPRWRVWKDTALIFFHFPLTGTGGGTFREVFPLYQTFPSEVTYLQTHNDYLQFLSENGAAMIAIYLAFFTILFGRLQVLMAGGLTRQRIIGIGAVCSLLSLSLHSITDFGVQIPAIPVAAAMILALVMSRFVEMKERVEC
jgi:O-antigen ligase